MLYTLQNENVNINYLAKLDFLDLCLLGETGIGKTRTAKLIHSLSPRKNAPFIAVNCEGLAGSLIESELFGYEKEPFTGAISSKQGKFEAANGGTLFLDEKVCLDTIFTASKGGETVKATTLTKEIIKQRLGNTSYLEGQSPMSPSSPVRDFMPGDRMEVDLERIRTRPSKKCPRDQ